MKPNYETIEDARTAFVNSGVIEEACLGFEVEIVEYMWRNNKTLEQALEENPGFAVYMNEATGWIGSEDDWDSLDGLTRVTYDTESSSWVAV